MDDKCWTIEYNNDANDITEKNVPFSYVIRYSCKVCGIKYEDREGLPAHHKEFDMSCVKKIDPNYICKKIAMY